jgi:hypothetical protein
MAHIIEEQGELPVAQIAALTQFARFAPDTFEQKSDVIVTHLVKKVLMVPCPVGAVRKLFHSYINAFVIDKSSYLSTG